MFKAMLRLIKHSAVYGTGYVLSRALMFFLLPVHTNFLSKAEYGVVTQLYAFIGIGAILYSLGLNTAEIQFYIREQDGKKRKELFSTAFYTTLVWSLCLSALLVVFRMKLSVLFFHDGLYRNLLPLAACILCFDVMALLGYNVQRAEEKSSAYALIHILHVAVNVACTFLFVVKHTMGPEGVFLANCIASAAAFISLSPVIRRLLVKMFSPSVLKRMLLFGLPFVPSILCLVLINVIDRFFITHMLGLEAAGIYGAGYKLGMIINLIVVGFSYAWHPFYLSMADDPKAKKLFGTVLTSFLLLCTVVFLLVTFNLNSIIRFSIGGITFFGKEFWDASAVVPVILLSYIVYGSVLIFQTGIYLKEKTTCLMLISGSGAVINIAGNAVLIGRLGIMGAAVSTFFSFATMAVMSYIIAQRYLRVVYNFPRIVHMTVPAAALYGLYAADLVHVGPWYGIVLVAGYLLILLITGFFSREEIRSIQMVLARLWQRYH